MLQRTNSVSPRARVGFIYPKSAKGLLVFLVSICHKGLRKVSLTKFHWWMCMWWRHQHGRQSPCTRLIQLIVTSQAFALGGWNYFQDAANEMQKNFCFNAFLLNFNRFSENITRTWRIYIFVCYMSGLTWIYSETIMFRKNLPRTKILPFSIRFHNMYNMMKLKPPLRNLFMKCSFFSDFREPYHYRIFEVSLK